MHLAQKPGLVQAGQSRCRYSGRPRLGNTIRLVNAGQAGVGGRSGLVGSARAKGATIRSVATFQHRTDLCILVDKDSPMQKVADLREQTVVVDCASDYMGAVHRRVS